MSLVRRTLPDGHSQLRLLPGLDLNRLANGAPNGDQTTACHMPRGTRWISKRPPPPTRA